MHLEFQAPQIQPLRQTFDHLARRFGDRPSTRYQEGTYDIQQTGPFHYRPTWDPDRMIFDEKRTAIRMRDWYDLKDPRQFYYGTYTMARSKMQDAADANFQHALTEGMAEELSDDARRLILDVLLPARHLEWGANMNNTFISAYGYGTAITTAAMFAAGDRLGMAQQISMIGLSLGGAEALDEAKRLWLHASQWQPLRRYIERTFVIRDWFEVFIAQNLVLDPLIFSFLYTEVAKVAGKTGTALFSLSTSFMKDWYTESARWVDAVVAAVSGESADNKALIRSWIASYRPTALAAVSALCNKALPASAEEVAARLGQHLDGRLIAPAL